MQIILAPVQFKKLSANFVFLLEMSLGYVNQSNKKLRIILIDQENPWVDQRNHEQKKKI